jgi:hypothetical protein
MEYQEYPKALYLAGQMLLVGDAEQEDAARADGYDDWHADSARGETVEETPAEPCAPVVDLAETENRLREWELQLTAREDDLSAREATLAEAVACHEATVQAQQAAAQLSSDTGGDTGTAGDPPLDREALKARATELGLTFARNITTENLAALVAEAQP